MEMHHHHQQQQPEIQHVYFLHLDQRKVYCTQLNTVCAGPLSWAKIIWKEEAVVEFLHRLSTFTLGPEEDFAVPQSLTKGRLCSGHGSEALGLLT